MKTSIIPNEIVEKIIADRTYGQALYEQVENLKMHPAWQFLQAVLSQWRENIIENIKKTNSKEELLQLKFMLEVLDEIKAFPEMAKSDIKKLLEVGINEEEQ